MTESEYTIDGLPVVSEDTIRALNDILLRSGKQFISGFRDYLSKENPNLVRIMDDFLNNEAGSVDFLYGFISGMHIMYESLRRQSAANKLERELGGK